MNTSTPRPSPSSFQALIKIHSFGLNRMDLTQREGKYDTPPWAPKTLGVEFSGWVEGLGDGDPRDFKIGDEVFGVAYGGEPAPENT
jgi:NADPH:quinone reductase-like Zn-dependent oxidoreductase